MLHLAVFMMQATLCENLQVEMVSQMFCSSADRVAIMAVRQLPPACDTYIHTYIHSYIHTYMHTRLTVSNYAFEAESITE